MRRAMTAPGDREGERFAEAVEAFNERRYFACHELLEELWREEPGAVRAVYQGILQIAVGCYHLMARSNLVGAHNKLEAGARRLEPHGRSFRGVDLRALIADADRLRASLPTPQAGLRAPWDQTLLPRIRAVDEGGNAAGT